MADKITTEKVEQEWQSRREDLDKLLNKPEDKKVIEEIGELNDYGLSIDTVEAGTFEGQREDYIRYQFSWGGPSDELRIFKNGDLEYWFLDWFDGGNIDVTHDKVAQQIADYVLEFHNFTPEE